MPMEAIGVLGSLAGIGEIAKATFGSDGSGGGGGGKTVPATPRKPTGPARRLHHARLHAAGLSEQRHVDRLSRHARHVELADSRPRVFFVLELIAPGAFMLWLGLSALLVGIISLFVDWPWQYQLVAFAVFALASIPLWRRFARRVEKPGDQPFLNRRAGCLRRPRVHAGEADRRGSGTVRIDDTIWRLAGPDCPGGSRVKVVRADAATLVVEAM